MDGLCNGTRLIVSQLLPTVVEATIMTGTCIGKRSLKKIGIYLPQPIFTHGQLYVALSRATSPSSLKIMINNDENTCQNQTINVVFKEYLSIFNNAIKILGKRTNQGYIE
uniref:ATP-dependent DNA helicase n=1 Tax=Lactuca sativa TaxID=4236 RepID=A0A9R1WE12_LACSA|nr:hypothetical protein LSAT_V11C200052010 [Lactuca sativa]